MNNTSAWLSKFWFIILYIFYWEATQIFRTYCYFHIRKCMCEPLTANFVALLYKKAWNGIQVIFNRYVKICDRSIDLCQYDSAIGYCRLRACERNLKVLQFSLEIRLSFRIFYGQTISRYQGKENFLPPANEVTGR